MFELPHAKTQSPQSKALGGANRMIFLVGI